MTVALLFPDVLHMRLFRMLPRDHRHGLTLAQHTRTHFHRHAGSRRLTPVSTAWCDEMPVGKEPVRRPRAPLGSPVSSRFLLSSPWRFHGMLKKRPESSMTRTGLFLLIGISPRSPPWKGKKNAQSLCVRLPNAGKWLR